jgi:hypothetical protein
MSINLSPYGAVPVEAAPPAPAAAEGHTLTLQLRARHPVALEVRASGTIEVAELERAAAKNSLHAAVVAVDSAPLTITFG